MRSSKENMKRIFFFQPSPWKSNKKTQNSNLKQGNVLEPAKPEQSLRTVVA